MSSSPDNVDVDDNHWKAVEAQDEHPLDPTFLPSLRSIPSFEIESMIEGHERELVQKGVAKKEAKEKAIAQGKRKPPNRSEYCPDKPSLEGLDALSAKYMIFNSPLGCGGYSIVHRGRNRITGVDVAVKVVPKAILDDQSLDMLIREVVICLTANHPNLIKVYDCYETDEHFYIVMEMLHGGSLFDLLDKTGRLSEGECVSMIHKVLFALKYLHSKGVAHRDVKVDNILFRNKPGVHAGQRLNGQTAFYGVRLADFGLASVEFAADPHKRRMFMSVGTIAYVAPEMLGTRGYTCKVDMWALGITMYVMRHREFPWPDQSRSSVIFPLLRKFEDVKQMQPDSWDLSDAGKDFLSKLLCRAPKRMTAADALKHPWIFHSASMMGLNKVTAMLVSRGYLSSSDGQSNASTPNEDAEKCSPPKDEGCPTTSQQGTPNGSEEETIDCKVHTTPTMEATAYEDEETESSTPATEAIGAEDDTRHQDESSSKDDVPLEPVDLNHSEALLSAPLLVQPLDPHTRLMRKMHGDALRFHPLMRLASHAQATRERARRTHRRMRSFGKGSSKKSNSSLGGSARSRNGSRAGPSAPTRFDAPPTSPGKAGEGPTSPPKSRIARISAVGKTISGDAMDGLDYLSTKGRRSGLNPKRLSLNSSTLADLLRRGGGEDATEQHPAPHVPSRFDRPTATSHRRTASSHAVPPRSRTPPVGDPDCVGRSLLRRSAHTVDGRRPPRLPRNDSPPLFVTPPPADADGGGGGGGGRARASTSGMIKIGRRSGSSIRRRAFALGNSGDKKE